ncbi:MAG TPA: CHASE2 domain-containing protein [Terracidiphilus sp.]|jgi:CHASE2 domain-containing sensor protein|nr:CHASE2 domain-containing protein [Terracidiphilus sp.]
MMTLDDILDHETARLQGFVENQRFAFLERLSHSKLALLVIAMMVVVFQMRNLPEQLANSSLDAAIAVERPVPPKSVRLVVIDDDDYKSLFHARSPLDPNALAELLTAVAKGHPQAVLVDLDTSDDSFRTMPVPDVPIIWNVAGEQLKDGKFLIDSPLGRRELPKRSVEALAIAPRDERGIVRGYQHSYVLESGGTVDSPGYAAAKVVAGHAPDDPASHAGQTHYLDFRYRFAPIKARDLLQDAQSPGWENLAFFNGQVVVVGGAYRVARDQYATPRGLMDGSAIVAQAAAAEIEGTYITPASRWMTGLLMIAGGLATLVVYHCFKFRTAFFISLGLVPLLSIASNWVLFHRFAAWGAMVPLVIAVIIAELYSKAALYLAFYQKVVKLKAKNGDRAPAEHVQASH